MPLGNTWLNWFESNLCPNFFYGQRVCGKIESDNFAFEKNSRLTLSLKNIYKNGSECRNDYIHLLEKRKNVISKLVASKSYSPRMRATE